VLGAMTAPVLYPAVPKNGTPLLRVPPVLAQG
jgi:hypothetical protein